MGTNENVVFVNSKDRGGIKEANTLWVILTYDTKLCSYREAWEQIELNLTSP